MRAKTNNTPKIQKGNGGITLDNFLSRLDKVRKFGKSYIARCPAHDDGRPSFRVTQGDKGILIRCWAGCSFGEIVAAMDLHPKDLFTDSLSDEKIAEYQYRSLQSKIKKLDNLLWFYDAEMRSGNMDDEGRVKYQGYITEIHSLRLEAYNLGKTWTLD